VILTTSTDMLPIVTLNWTEVIEVSEKFIQNAETTLFTADTVMFPDLGISNIDSTGMSLVDALTSTWTMDPDQ